MNQYKIMCLTIAASFFSSVVWAQETPNNNAASLDETETTSKAEDEHKVDDSSAADQAAAAAAKTTEELEKQVEETLALFSFEPSIEELKRAALSYQDADTHTSRHWRTAPNRAALLPTLKLVFDRNLERDESLDRYQDEPDRWGADSDNDSGFQIQAQWRLDELVFNSDEVRVWSALAERASRRESILMMLISYYFERRKLQLELILSPPKDLMAMADLNLRIAELTSSIDALTGGYLSSVLEKRLKEKKSRQQ